MARKDKKAQKAAKVNRSTGTAKMFYAFIIGTALLTVITMVVAISFSLL